MFAEVKSNPLVSIACITYNHESYIKQCLDGFIMQKTNFAYEIVIHDDASSDKTQDIILEYCRKYPKLFRPILQKENKYKEGKGILARFVFPECKGKYIALCEGDDYWTDPLKLQKQVDFLESNPEYSVCGHRLLAYNEQSLTYEMFDTGIQGEYQLIDLISKHVFCSTLSIVFRVTALDLEHYLKCRVSMDIVLAYMLLKSGKGYCLLDNMAVYRVHNGGMWSGSNRDYHITTNLDVRFAIYELERTNESALFILTYIKKLGRRWIIKNVNLFVKSLKYIQEQMGLKYTVIALVKIILNKK